MAFNSAVAVELVLIVKCPYSCKDKPFQQRTEEESFLEEKVSGDLVVKKNHAYYLYLVILSYGEKTTQFDKEFLLMYILLQKLFNPH